MEVGLKTTGIMSDKLTNEGNHTGLVGCTCKINMVFTFTTANFRTDNVMGKSLFKNFIKIVKVYFMNKIVG